MELGCAVLRYLRTKYYWSTNNIPWTSSELSMELIKGQGTEHLQNVVDCGLCITVSCNFDQSLDIFMSSTFALMLCAYLSLRQENGISSDRGSGPTLFISHVSHHLPTSPPFNTKLKVRWNFDVKLGRTSGHEFIMKFKKGHGFLHKVCRCPTVTSDEN